MLTAMTREGRDYAEVLAEAQAKGYAEADPTADVEGLDALNKLVILARLAFGAWIDPSAVSNRPGTTTGAAGLPGITGVTAEDVAALVAEGRVLRLIATTRLAEDGADRGRRSCRRPSPRSRRSAAATASSTASRSTGCPSAASRSRARAPAVPPRPRPCSSDLVSIARGLGSTWAGDRGRHGALLDRGPARRRRVRRGALGRVLPRGRLSAPGR